MSRTPNVAGRLASRSRRSLRQRSSPRCLPCMISHGGNGKVYPCQETINDRVNAGHAHGFDRAEVVAPDQTCLVQLPPGLALLAFLNCSASLDRTRRSAGIRMPSFSRQALHCRNPRPVISCASTIVDARNSFSTPCTFARSAASCQKQAQDKT